jgi:hypothetical protein
MPPLRGRVPPPQVPPAARAALRRLAQAHELMERGAFAEAAAIFAELADAAERRSIPRAPQLHLQAGRAWLHAGFPDQAVHAIRHALRQMQAYGQDHRLRAVLPAITEAMRTRNMKAEAQALEVEFADQLQAVSAFQEEDPARRERLHLPPKCPYCGGIIHPAEVDWIGEAAAQCDYCGSVVEAQA